MSETKFIFNSINTQIDNISVMLLQILAYYSLFLAIAGTIGNCLTFIICYRLRSTTTFVFLMVSSIFDTTALYFWNVNQFTSTILDIDLQNLNKLSCKFGMYVQFTSLQISAWLLVAMSIDRLMSVWISRWRISYFKKRQAIISSLTVLLLIMVINLNVPFTYSHDIVVNGTAKIQCFATSDPKTHWMQVWEMVSLIICFIFFQLRSSRSPNRSNFLRFIQRSTHTVLSPCSWLQTCC